MLGHLVRALANSKGQKTQGRRPRCALGRLFFVLFLSASLAACAPRTPVPTPAPEFLTLSGSTSMVPLLERLAEQFEAVHPNVTVTIEGGNSAQVLGSVLDGTDRSARDGATHLDAISITPPEGLWFAPIALDGIAVVVHPDNPAQSLTLAQLYNVFSGRIWQWSKLGVQLARNEIVVVSREDGSAARAIFDARIMTLSRSPGGDCPPVLPMPGVTPAAPACEADAVTTMAVLMPGSAAALDFVQEHVEAVGYISRAYLSAQPQAPQVKILRIEDAPPDAEYVADGRYPLIQPFYLIAAEEPTGVGRQFVDFCLGAKGQEIVGRYAVPVRK